MDQLDSNIPSPGSNALPQRPYRSKKVRPCDLCRTRKVACMVDDGASACSLCLRRGLECTFQSRPGIKSRPGYRPARIDQAMTTRGHTCFYAGTSGDQGPSLLRHLSFNEQNMFGNAAWSAWRVHPRIHNPVYFTVFPDASLDVHCDMYTNAKIEQLLGPYSMELIELYYGHVHPSYPIMEPKEDFIRRRQAGKVRISLLSCIYLLAMDFWSASAALARHPVPQFTHLWDDIYAALTTETRTPNLDTVKGLLLYMQLPSHFVKEPNRPGLWALTNLLAGVSEDIGLHVDPSAWHIPLAERKARRILWWAVYVHEKWTAHFLGRRPHLNASCHDVQPLVVDDFSDESSRIHLGDLEAARVFIAFSQLSCLLEDILEYFFRASPGEYPADDSVGDIMARLSAWRDKISLLGKDVSTSASQVSVLRIACHTMELSIGRIAPQPSQFVVQTSEHILQILDDIAQIPVDGFWPSYCTGNLEIVGSVLLTLCLSSVDEPALDKHMNLLLKFRERLQKVSQTQGSRHEMGRLPLIRLNLILDRLSQPPADF